MNELSLGVLGVILGCSFSLAGIFLGVRYSKVQSFGRLSKRVYLGIVILGEDPRIDLPPIGDRR